MRELTNTFYKTFAVEAESQADLYSAVAEFVSENPGALIEAISPGYFVEDGEGLYTLVVTLTL